MTTAIGLELGPGGGELELEARALAGEVLLELGRGGAQRVGVVAPVRVDLERRHAQAGERAVLGGEQQLADRAVDGGVVGHARLQMCWTA
jgi:hypothetical protein